MAPLLKVSSFSFSSCDSSFIPLVLESFSHSVFLAQVLRLPSSFFFFCFSSSSFSSFFFFFSNSNQSSFSPLKSSFQFIFFLHRCASCLQCQVEDSFFAFLFLFFGHFFLFRSHASSSCHVVASFFLVVTILLYVM